MPRRSLPPIGRSISSFVTLLLFSSSSSFSLYNTTYTLLRLASLYDCSSRLTTHSSQSIPATTSHFRPRTSLVFGQSTASTCTMAPTLLFAPLPHPGPDELNDNAVAITKLFRESGPGTTILLSPRQVYPLYSSIDFVHPRTTLATMNYPTFDSGDQAILETRGEKEAGAVNMYNKPETSLKRVHLKGCRGWGRTLPSDEDKEKMKKEGKLGWIEGGGALVWMGGPESYDSLVEGCRLEDPRGWTSLHLCDWAIRNRVLNNLVGPCGQEAPGGPWADGLSIAGKDSIIFDATDGAIVVFCAPGTMVSDNTIIARGRNLLGAINMVDDFPFDRDFKNTRVIGNTIKTEGAYIRLAIGCGPTCWSPWQDWHKINEGGYVQNNYLGPGKMGYGIALSGAKDWTVLGNVIMPQTRFIGDVKLAFWNAPPCPFLLEWDDRGRTINCDLQEGFLRGEASYLIGCDDGVGELFRYEQGQLRLDSKGHSQMGAGGIVLKGARYEVGRKGEVLLRRVQEGHEYDGKIGEGEIVWSSGTSSTQPVNNPILEFTLDGRLSTKSNSGQGESLWDPTDYISSHLERMASLPALKTPTPPKPAEDPSKPDPSKWQGHTSVILRSKQPYIEVRDKTDNVVYSTSYVLSNKDNWAMHENHWIAVAPSRLRGSTSSIEPETSLAPPVIPPRPAQMTSHHPFRSFVKDLATDLIDSAKAQTSNSSVAPPAIPPRPAGFEEVQKPLKPVFLFLNPATGQLFLHSSSSPAHPEPENIHWVVPAQPIEGPPVDACWVAFQYDGNLVVYAKRGEEVFAPWATMSVGEHQAVKMVLLGHDDPGGPALELTDAQGTVRFSSRTT